VGIWKKSVPGVKFKYKGKWYFFDFLYLNEKGPEKIRPIDEPENEADEITVKDYKRGNWNITLNVNGETIAVGWGSSKHFVFWGGIVFVIFMILVFIRGYRCYLRKKEIRFLRSLKKSSPSS